MQKKTNLILVILLVVTNGWWLMNAYARLVTEDCREYQEYHTIPALAAVATELVSGSSRQDLLDLLGRVLPEEKPLETSDGILATDYLEFSIADDGSIAGVHVYRCRARQ